MLFVLWEGDLHRTTRDLDLFGSSAIGDIEQAIREIAAVEVEDNGVEFVTKTVRGDLIREE